MRTRRELSQILFLLFLFLAIVALQVANDGRGAWLESQTHRHISTLALSPAATTSLKHR